ncbi:MAG: transcription-repair coupling factor [Pseudomonadota bacterium]|nr:transcription-repair coupling factor [Pseudomonadota bacterium]
MPLNTHFINFLKQSKDRTLISGVPEGFDAFLMAILAKNIQDILVVARDDVSMSRKAEALQFFAPEVECMTFPAWDCLPYDRVSPQATIVNQRIDTLTRLAETNQKMKSRIILTTVSAISQRIPPRKGFSETALVIETGQKVDLIELDKFLTINGYFRSDTVMEPGEFAKRGGILDVFPTGSKNPLRLDLFGDELENLREFDPISQISTHKLNRTVLKPATEVLLDESSITLFRSGYRALCAKASDDDPLYESISAGKRYIGMEHWLPLFHGYLETLLDYLPGAHVIFDYQSNEAHAQRMDLIEEYYLNRKNFSDTNSKGILSQDGVNYHPVPTKSLFLDTKELNDRLAKHHTSELSPFVNPESKNSIDAGGRNSNNFSNVRVRPDINIFDALNEHILASQESGKQVILTAFTQGSRDRLISMISEHGFKGIVPVDSWQDARNLNNKLVAICVVGLERGFYCPASEIENIDLEIISETDILGERIVRSINPTIKPENFIAEASSLRSGDLVVHIDHGIGRFEDLQSIKVGGAPHDCLKLVYADDNKLFLPVENIEVISRYGSEEAGARLDRLGGAAWQARKANLKDRIREIADDLIRIAAAREIKSVKRINVEQGAYNEFSSRFPFSETDDQVQAINDTLRDLASDRSMDRLICGDVGFGKTEVALRAAFASSMAGRQVLVVVPTTLLCRQHFQNFKERFKNYPIRIKQMSRLVPVKKIREVKKGLIDGTVDIVIGTHALLAKDVMPRDLGLLVIDEEQHFGVTHKEQLKSLKANVHVLTLTATPIPRTLQLALSGIRQMSLIATPPVDRLAVRTYILPYDPIIIREAILREKFRGGQIFYVCPRVKDLKKITIELSELVPEAKFGVVHGRMKVDALENAMTNFYNGKFDILVSTNIIESGLDLPSVNTIIIHRADMFGLAQLYQLRGRVGRSNTRAYAYLTLPPGRVLTKAAEKRLEVMQTLDTLGAGFSLASHDLDIRGAGNLLGSEQSGHIREVGVELYQQMLEEAVIEARGIDEGVNSEEKWSPIISIGLPVLIPESYIDDLGVRMELYRRLSSIDNVEAIEMFAAELIDRFGTLPNEVENLLQTVTLKTICRNAGIEKIEAGIKGAVLSFHNNKFSNPAGLVDWITSHKGTTKLRSDHKLVYKRQWDSSEERLKGVKFLVNEIFEISQCYENV